MISSARTSVSQQISVHKPRLHARPALVNVGDTERWASAIGGGVLTLVGLSRRSLPGLALAGVGAGLLYRGVAGHCNLYQALGVSTAQERGPATSVQAGQGVRVDKTITIDRPAEALYNFWKNFQNLARFMRHIEEVTYQVGRTHWVARGPAGIRFEWDAEVINERPDAMIAWRSLPGSTVNTAGSVHFTPAPNGRGTEVRVVLKYDPPTGKVGALLARLFGQDPGRQIEEDLRRFKQLMEAGEVATTERQKSRSQAGR